MKVKSISLGTGCLVLFAVYVLSAVLFWVIAKDQLCYQVNTSNMLSAYQTVGEISDGAVVEQDVYVTDQEILSVSLRMATYARDYNQGYLKVEVLDSDCVCGVAMRDVSELRDNCVEDFVFEEPIQNAADKTFTLRLTSNAAAGYGVTVMYGNSVNTARGNVPSNLLDNQLVRRDGEPLDGMLCAQLTTKTALWYGSYYGWFVAAGGLLLGIYLIYMISCEKHNKSCIGRTLISVCQRYLFLIQQLVAKDFKNKYKRSVLGALWSFFNPLLTMLVQYVVFSSIFKSDMENFVVYLLTGIVFFNFFSEATNMAMSSIVGNSALITKVYVPKYIYPLSRVLSSGVNFLISMIPLVLVILITKVEITSAVLLIIFPMVCNFFLALGMGLMLSSIMVFFRDTQFIYGVILTTLMYLTPIFYPVTIIPEKYRWMFQLNPICNNITFARSCILDGVFPGVKTALLCAGFAAAAMVAGAYMFKKTQDRFIFHI